MSFFVLAQPSRVTTKMHPPPGLSELLAGLLALGLQNHSSNDGLRYHGGYRCRKERRQRRYDEQESDPPPLLRQEGSCCRRIEPTGTTTNKRCRAEQQQHGTCRTNGNDASDSGTTERAAAVAAAEGDAAYTAISKHKSEDSAFSSFSRG